LSFPLCFGVYIVYMILLLLLLSLSTRSISATVLTDLLWMSVGIS
jgi:hypothetical protein